MKKLIIILIFIFLLLASFASGFFVKKFIDDKKFLNSEIEKIDLKENINQLEKLNNTLNKTVNLINIRPIDFYLYDDDPNRFDKININKDGNVEYKGKVLYKDNGEPLNDDTAYSTLEIKIIIAAKHIEPREGCDPTDTYTNGELGCYIDIPDDN